MIAHEGVAEVVDPAVVNCGEIPRPACASNSVATAWTDMVSAMILPRACKRLSLVLIHLLVFRDERADEFAGQLHRIDAQFAERSRERSRMNRAAGQRWVSARFADGLGEMVGHHHAIDRFGGMRRPPADHERTMAGLVQDVPDRLGFAGEESDGATARPVGQRFA